MLRKCLREDMHDRYIIWVITRQSPTGSITFTLDRAKRVRIARFVGVITDRVLIDAYEPLLRDPAFDSTQSDLVDLRDVSQMDVTSGGLHRLIALYEERGPTEAHTRNAIFAPSDVLYGVARMFQTLRGEVAPAEIEIFRHLEAAERWMARLPDSAASG